MKLLLAFVLLQFGQAFAQSAEQISQTLQEEWSRFRAHVEEVTADGDVGGYMDYKEYGDMTLLWRTSGDPSDNEVVRFYMSRENSSDWFSVTYHKSSSIIDGRTVLRRFVGPEPSGWINHTIDYHTGEYLGSQGYFPYALSDSELEMMKAWNIRLMGKE